VWGETSLQLPEGVPEAWHNVLTGDSLTAAPAAGGRRALALSQILNRFPVALVEAAG
jgi:maltooligosyltrehalose synthase